jgi:hypothetical protein
MRRIVAIILMSILVLMSLMNNDNKSVNVGESSVIDPGDKCGTASNTITLWSGSL